MEMTSATFAQMMVRTRFLVFFQQLSRTFSQNPKKSHCSVKRVNSKEFCVPKQSNTHQIFKVDKNLSQIQNATTNILVRQPLKIAAIDVIAQNLLRTSNFGVVPLVSWETTRLFLRRLHKKP